MHKGYGLNEYGTPVSFHICDTCGSEFNVCPAKTPEAKGWGSCMSTVYPSYDPRRDADKLFGEGKVMRDDD